MDEIIRFLTLEGTWEVGGADRRRGIWPEDLQCTWDEWGPKTANFILRRDPGLPQVDIMGLTPIEIEKDGALWEGFIDQAPAVDEHAVSVEAIGWSDHGNDDVEQKKYVHTNLSDYQDMSTFPNAVLGSARLLAAARVSNEGGAIQLAFPKNTALVVGNYVGVVLDLGPGNTWKRAVLDYETSNNDAAALVYIRGASTPDETSWTINDAISGVAITTLGASGQSSGTITTASRYLHIFLYYNSAGTITADEWLQIKGLRVFTDAVYESGGQSILKTSDVLKDALPRLCPQWSQDLTGIDATLFNLPEMSPTQPRTFRELIDALNSFHGYIRKLERGKRLRFKPEPLTPVLVAGEWDGIDYRDTSKNATRDIYNRAVGNCTSPDGSPLEVVRWAAQQPGVVSQDVVGSPAASNPSFATDATSWTEVGPGTIVRDTVVFDTSPASGKWDSFGIGDTLTETFTGTFKRGQLYEMIFSSRANEATGHSVTADFGHLASGDYSSIHYQLEITFDKRSIVWLPRADRTSVVLRMTYTGEESD